MTTLKEQRSQETLERHAVLVPGSSRDQLVRILGVIAVIAIAITMGFLVVQSDDAATTDSAIPADEWVLPETQIPLQTQAAPAVSASEAARARYGLEPFDIYALPEMFPVYDPFRIAADVWALPEASIAAAEQATDRELAMARYGIEPFDATLPETAPVSTLSESELARLVYGLDAFDVYILPEAFVPEQFVVGDSITAWDPVPAADWVLPEMFLPEQTTPAYVIPAYGPR